MQRNIFTFIFLGILFLLSFTNLYPFSQADTSKVMSWQEMMDSCIAYQNVQEYQTALNWALQAEVKAKAEFGEMDTNYVATIGKISGIWYYMGSIDSAIYYGNIQLKYSRIIFKSDHPDLAGSINNMASFYNSRGEYSKAKPLYIEAMEMYRRIFKSDHPNLANSINNIAAFYFSQGDYSKAEPLFIEALEMRRRIFKSDHPDLAESISWLAYYYNRRGDYSKAEPFYIEVLEMKRRIFKSDHPDLAKSINNIALFYHRRGDYSKAEPLYLEALEMRRQIFKSDHPDLATSINNMAMLYESNSDYSKAEPLLIEALEMRRRIFNSDHPDLAQSINNIALLYKSRGEYSKAEPLFIEALEMSRRIFKSNHPDLATSINNIASFYNDKGDYSKAEPLFIEALEMYRRIYKSNHPDLANSINKMAYFYKNRSEYSKAEPLFIEALEMYRRIFKSDHPALANSINNMAYFYHLRGDYSKSEKLFVEALEMNRRIFKIDHPDLAQSINNMAYFYDSRDDYSKAGPLFIEALEMYRRIFKSDHPDLASSINNMAYFYDGRGEYSKAEPLYIEALEMYRRIFKSGQPGLAVSINNLALFYNNRGEYSKAEPLYIEALEMSRRIFKSDHPDLAQSIKNIALFYSRKGEYSKAEPLYIEALEMYKSIFTKQSINLSETEKEKFWNTMTNNFELFHTYANKRCIDNPSIFQKDYNNLLFTKGLILSSTNKMKESIHKSCDSSAINLFNRWTDLKRFISKNSALTNEELKKKFINLDSLEKASNKYEKELSLKSSAFASVVSMRQCTWQDVQSRLKKGEAAVEIVRYKYHDGKRWIDTVNYAVLILKPGNKKNHIDFVLLENGNEFEHIYIKNYKNYIKNKLQDNESYGAFWTKIAEKLKGVKKIYVSTDGVYNQLNLATLYNPKTKKYLLEETDIRIVTSTRDLVVNKEQKNQEYNNTAVLIGNPRFNLDKTEYKKVATALESKQKEDYYIDEGTEITMRSGISPLPGTGVEIDKIYSMLLSKNWIIEKFTDSMAIEEAVKKVNNPRVLHIATHGKFLTDVERQYSNFDTEMDRQRFVENPLLRSFLIFAGADCPDSTKNTALDDGFLTAYEAQNLYLDKTELVVLSACETGLGEIKNGEGVYGLQRAFIQAGAKTIIMSLWSVSDEATQELMSTFYKEWLGGKTKREAFSRAQLNIRSKYPEPYYWGAFVMVGE